MCHTRVAPLLLVMSSCLQNLGYLVCPYSQDPDCSETSDEELDNDMVMVVVMVMMMVRLQEIPGCSV